MRTLGADAGYGRPEGETPAFAMALHVMRSRRVRDGLSRARRSYEDGDMSAELRAAKRRIAQLERAVAIARRFRNAESSGDIREIMVDFNRALAPAYEIVELKSPRDGVIKEFWLQPGESAEQGHAVLVLEPGASADHVTLSRGAILDHWLVREGQTVCAGDLVAVFKGGWNGDNDPDDPDAPPGTDEPPPSRPADSFESF